MIDRIFWICVEFIQQFRNVTDLGYELATFVFIYASSTFIIVVFFFFADKRSYEKERRMYDKEKNNRS
jgi:hypothetical protein